MFWQTVMSSPPKFGRAALPSAKARIITGSKMAVESGSSETSRKTSTFNPSARTKWCFKFNVLLRMKAHLETPTRDPGCGHWLVTVIVISFRKPCLPILVRSQVCSPVPARDTNRERRAHFDLCNIHARRRTGPAPLSPMDNILVMIPLLISRSFSNWCEASACSALTCRFTLAVAGLSALINIRFHFHFHKLASPTSQRTYTRLQAVVTDSKSQPSRENGSAAGENRLS
jgi:hypothetical protein